VRLVNKASVEAAKQLPGEAGELATILDLQIADWVQEFGGALSMGQAVTDDRLKLLSKNLKMTWGTGQFDAALAQAYRNISIRRLSLDNAQARTSTSSGYAPMPEETGQTVTEEMRGIGGPPMPLASGVKASAPTTQQASLPPYPVDPEFVGKTIEGPDGKQYIGVPK